jgi:hypothetical protein
MSLVGTWIPADSSQSGGLDFRFVVAMVESPKGVQFHFPRWQKKGTLFFLFFFFFYLSRSLFSSFLLPIPKFT